MGRKIQIFYIYPKALSKYIFCTAFPLHLYFSDVTAALGSSSPEPQPQPQPAKL